jgi:lysozyme
MIIASPRRISRAGLELAQGFEGCKLASYPDPGSGGAPFTIGFGSTGADIVPGLKWTQEQCNDRFAADMQCFALAVDKLIGPAPTTQGQFDALVDFAYNLGEGNLGASTLLRMHKAGDHEGAAGQFARWNRASGKTMAGLTRRRNAEAAMYRGDPK